jgi:hypothetical protein
MAADSRGWGYRRIQGALANLDQHVSRAPSQLSSANGLEPAPDRVQKTTWIKFLLEVFATIAGEP